MEDRCTLSTMFTELSNFNKFEFATSLNNHLQGIVVSKIACDKKGVDHDNIQGNKRDLSCEGVLTGR